MTMRGPAIRKHAAVSLLALNGKPLRFDMASGSCTTQVVLTSDPRSLQWREMEAGKESNSTRAALYDRIHRRQRCEAGIKAASVEVEFLMGK